MKMDCRRLFGFTLIELLIVVAIIAILAAIAVPNFLEAQTRSKVSRAKSDLRTISLALESYKIDNGRYPNTKHNPLSTRMCKLTSPVAYLSNVLYDVFNPGEDSMSSPYAQNNVYTLGTIEVSGNPNASNWLFFNTIVLSYYAYQMGVSPDNLSWVAFSYGPMMNASGWIKASKSYAPTHTLSYQGQSVAVMGYMDVVYDPTNGTVSAGIVTRVGP